MSDKMTPQDMARTAVVQYYYASPTITFDNTQVVGFFELGFGWGWTAIIVVDLFGSTRRHEVTYGDHHDYIEVVVYDRIGQQTFPIRAGEFI